MIVYAGSFRRGFCISSKEAEAREFQLSKVLILFDSFEVIRVIEGGVGPQKLPGGHFGASKVFYIHKV